jgi:ankyrin repeat protein
MISFLTAPAHRPIERQTKLRLVAGNSSVIRAQRYQIPIEILLSFIILLKIATLNLSPHKMNDDERHKKLINAIDKNDTASASSLISSGYVNLNVEPLPLHRAAWYGRVEIMTMLLDAGADINAVDGNRHTACRVAILYNEFDALKLLVERGANLDVVDFNGRSLLSIYIVARLGRDERFAILLLDAGAPLDGLSNGKLMALVTSVAVFNRLMARGVNFTTMRDGSGRTLFHYVARSVACENDLRFFLANVCSNDAVHAVDNDGITPLHYASLSGNHLAVRVLVELGADIDQQNKLGAECFDRCCREDEIFTCRIASCTRRRRRRGRQQW